MRQSQTDWVQKKREAIGKLHIDKTDWIGVTIINYTMLDFILALGTSDCYQPVYFD